MSSEERALVRGAYFIMFFSITEINPSPLIHAQVGREDVKQAIWHLVVLSSSPNSKDGFSWDDIAVQTAYRRNHGRMPEDLTVAYSTTVTFPLWRIFRRSQYSNSKLSPPGGKHGIETLVRVGVRRKDSMGSFSDAPPRGMILHDFPANPACEPGSNAIARERRENWATPRKVFIVGAIRSVVPTNPTLGFGGEKDILNARAPQGAEAASDPSEPPANANASYRALFSALGKVIPRRVLPKLFRPREAN
ncbi:hypothetical protein R3P38DRAFT_2814854 [Favolaschia claudopus]|uniref:Uncharacterized protein n=1 Tax=Favolaschia claudopus TaxID=2862362 RepID=A0AAV9Z2F2_9AGAR